MTDDASCRDTPHDWADPCPAKKDDSGPGLPWNELREFGILWLINKAVFHPRGFAFGIVMDEDGTISGWSMSGDGSEPWNFPEAVDDECFARVEEFLNVLRKK